MYTETAVSRVCGLYAIPPETADLKQLQEWVGHAIRGGARIVQYRAKTLSGSVRLLQASALARQCREQGTVFIVNDHTDLAHESGADGVHLGQSDLEGMVARPPRPFLVGISCHDDLDLARKAYEWGADYVAFGSFFPSPTKPAARPVPLSVLQQARHRIPLPLVAIGGITPERASDVINAGAHAIAVISSLFHKPDCIFSTARQFSLCFQGHHD